MKDQIITFGPGPPPFIHPHPQHPSSIRLFIPLPPPPLVASVHPPERRQAVVIHPPEQTAAAGAIIPVSTAPPRDPESKPRGTPVLLERPPFEL